jgi:polar amino acid transport system substrate-binding protein
MNATPSIRLARLSLTLVAAGLCTSAIAADGLDRAKQNRKLVAGVHYVVPEYKAGMKFRTPETVDTALLDDLTQRLHVSLSTVRIEPGKQVQSLRSGKVDVALAMIGDSDPLLRNATVIPTGYAAGPMAIMRSDTTIKAWEHLKGRKVCVSEGGQYVGTLASKYGAIEKVYRAPADALIAVRIGECDATVHDNVMLEELIKLPEWKKFSATLPVGPRARLAFVVPSADKTNAAFLKQVTDEWATKGHVDQLVKKSVRNIAFEVYLDQNVPDCH